MRNDINVWIVRTVDLIARQYTRPMNLKMCLRRLAVVVAILSLGSCVAYAPMPVGMQPTRFDQSWAAASGALFDQGLTITTQDRNTGVIRGERGDTSVTVTLESLPDGRVQVKFNSTGDSTVVERVSQSYERRMGR
jgi:hypothetical protein